jgi:hypothetical protein
MCAMHREQVAVLRGDTMPSVRVIASKDEGTRTVVEGVPGAAIHVRTHLSSPFILNKNYTSDTGVVRTFTTGATRDTAQDKPDYEGFLSPLVLERFGQYMLKHQIQSDGTIRASDNWTKGIPKPVYIKSLWRHVLQAWKLHRGYPVTDEQGRPVSIDDALCAIMFNAMGYLYETLAKRDV